MFFKLATAVTVLSCLLVGCDKLPTDENRAKNAVRKVLIDPDSAIFSDTFKSTASETTCGWVNSRNRMAGYVGKKPFYHHITSGEVLALSEPPNNSDFEKYFRSIPNSTSSDTYIELATRCKEVPDWENQCGKKLSYSRNKFCDIINVNDGKQFAKALRAEFEP